MYRQVLCQHAHDWLDRHLDAINRSEVERRFLEVSTRVGPVAANKLVVLLGAVYRGPCVDYPGLRSPVAMWRAGGGRLHPARRRTIAPPAEVLPCWRRGIDAVPVALVRDMAWFGLFTGLRRCEVSGLRWEHVDAEQGRFRIEENKSARTLDLPITHQVAAILERRRPRRAAEGWDTQGLGVPWTSETRPFQPRERLVWLHQRDGRGEVLVSRVPQLLHHGGGPRLDAARQPRETLGKPCTVARRHGRLRRRVDTGAAPRGGAAHRG